MCGIMGYTGAKDAVPLLLKGLHALEYRGYDSAGIAVRVDGGVRVIKKAGRVERLDEAVMSAHLSASCGIGHTRWATHGAPSDINAHPHRVGRVTLVHNGILENDAALRRERVSSGDTPISDTDSESIAWLMNECCRRGELPLCAMREVASRLRGAYAVAMLLDDRHDEILVMRRGSPLLVARGANGTLVASDIPALLPYTREYTALEDGDMAVLRPDQVLLFDANGTPVHRPSITAKWDVASAERGGYRHFMLKEIMEEPDVLQGTLNAYTRAGMPFFDLPLVADDRLAALTGVRLLGCGTAFHAGLTARYALESWARLPARCDIASEFRDMPPFLTGGEMALAISQSGETADTLAAARLARTQGAPVLAVVNAVASTLEREADGALSTYAGPEISVASTKAYAAQTALLNVLALRAALARGAMGEAAVREKTRALHQAPGAVREVLAARTAIASLARSLAPARHAFFIGRRRDEALAREGSLKLKEISYIHSESCPAGEMKHGTISLMEDGTPVIAVLTEGALGGKTALAVREVRARGARVTLIARREWLREMAHDDEIPLPDVPDACLPFAAAAAMQLLAYETANARGCDVDKPRNLAKSVTVE